MNIPYYTFSIPYFKIYNNKIIQTRGASIYLITPISISKLILGNIETDNDKFYQNVYFKTITIFDAFNIFLKMSLVVFISFLVLTLSLIIVYMVGVQ